MNDDSGKEAFKGTFQTIIPTAGVAYEFEALGDGATISVKSSSNGS